MHVCINCVCVHVCFHPYSPNQKGGGGGGVLSRQQGHYYKLFSFRGHLKDSVDSYARDNHSWLFSVP